MPEVKMKEETLTLLAFGFFIIGGMVLGFCINELWEIYTNEKTVDGLWIPTDNINKTDALKYAYSQSVGNWICVNIEGMRISDMESTIKHEIGHEIFAQKCANDWSKCSELMEEQLK